MNIGFKSKQADICKWSKSKLKPQTCTFIAVQVRVYTKAPTEGKKILALEANSCAGGNFILDVQNYDFLFSACVVNGFLATQIPAAMVESGCCQFCLCLRDKTSSECFSSEFIR